MNNLIATSEKIAVIGMGMTGFSAVRYLQNQKKSVAVFDTRIAPPQLERFKQEFPEVEIVLGDKVTENSLLTFSRVVVSPGVSVKEAFIANAIEKNINVVGDVQLFIEAITAPLIAVTGSNAKSTVTTLVGEMAKASGIDVAVAGNIGIPVLDLLQEEQKELYVLELSSFQLETIEKLNASVACSLNVSMDHMDRYESFAAYHAAKQRVYFGAEKIVVNRDDELTKPPLRSDMSVMSFGMGSPDLKTFGVISENGQAYLARGLDKLLAVSELKMKGKHNIANALAALAIGSQAEFSIPAMIGVLKEFKGLAHRCESVASIENVDYINDSKGTNVGATIAALNGLARLPNKIILIAGGEGKGADFSLLAKPVKQYVRAVIVFGADAKIIAKIAEAQNVLVEHVDSMKSAVLAAKKQARSGDVVLLSPACASFDMFKNFEHRGESFVKCVEDLAA
ncbi:MAG: UDP-N-acetylmuramoyl-L-alanine--D-glutamate ligase [Cellvibrionaceae bacterium]